MHRFNRINTAKTYLVLLACFSLTACGDPSERSPGPGAMSKPNIILILADDLGFADTSVYGSNQISTPHIDQLATRGVQFSQAYVSHPVCSPSRAGLVTGRYQQRHGWEFNPAGRDTAKGMSTEERTFADVLRDTGYATGMVGKWHLGYEGDHHPLARGFDEYFGVLAGGSTFIDSSAPGVESLGDYPAQRPAKNGVYRGRELVTVTDYLTDVFTTEAISFIDRHQNEPFFLYLSHTTPHTPLQATAKYLDRYRHIEDPATRIYSAMVASLDDSVGAVITKLEEIGQRDNTFIVFTSDNGCADYIRGACSNAPLAGYKRYHNEGGIRVPFIFSWPNHIPSGQQFSSPVSSLDLLATFGAAAGQTEATEDSVNLLPYLTGELESAPHDYLYWRSGPTKAIRDERWKLIRYNRTPYSLDDLGFAGRLQPPAEGWGNDSPLGQLTLLYDLEVDAAETTNIANEHPEVVARLDAAYEKWDRSITASPLMPGIRSTVTEIHGDAVQLIF